MYADVIQGMYHDTGCIGFRAIAQKNTGSECRMEIWSTQDKYGLGEK